MADISLETVTGKLNRVGYDAFMRSLRHAKNAGNRNLELAHWMLPIISNDRSDLAVTLDHYKIDRARVLSQVVLEHGGVRIVTDPVKIRGSLGIPVLSVIAGVDAFPATRGHRRIAQHMVGAGDDDPVLIRFDHALPPLESLARDGARRPTPAF